MPQRSPVWKGPRRRLLAEAFVRRADSRRSGEETRGPEEERRGDGTGADVVGQADNWDDNRGGEGDAEGRVMMNDDHSFLTSLLVPLW